LEVVGISKTESSSHGMGEAPIDTMGADVQDFL